MLYIIKLEVGRLAIFGLRGVTAYRELLLLRRTRGSGPGRGLIHLFGGQHGPVREPRVRGGVHRRGDGRDRHFVGTRDPAVGGAVEGIEIPKFLFAPEQLGEFDDVAPESRSGALLKVLQAFAREDRTIDVFVGGRPCLLGDRVACKRGQPWNCEREVQSERYMSIYDVAP